MTTVSHRRIKITPAFQRLSLPNVIDVFRITIVASCAHEMPTRIFAYRAIPLQPDQTTQVGVFDHVCSPVDLEEYPESEPRVNAVPPWFRLDTVDLEFRTRSEALDTYADLLADVTSLVNSLNAADDMIEQMPIWIGFTQAEAEAVGSSIGSEGSSL